MSADVFFFGTYTKTMPTRRRKLSGGTFQNRKIRIGPRGGKYILKGGRKMYLSGESRPKIRIGPRGGKFILKGGKKMYLSGGQACAMGSKGICRKSDKDDGKCYVGQSGRCRKKTAQSAFPIIISGFMGIGKSTFAKKYPNTLDLDSAGFSWCPGDRASDKRVQKLIEKHSSCDKTLNERTRNPNATSDYVNAIKDAMKSTKYEYIFVSTHESTRKWLHENKIPFILVYPAEDRKDEWVKNLTERGTSGLAKFLQSNWSTGINLIGGLKKDKFHTKKIIMEHPYFLSDYAEILNFS